MNFRSRGHGRPSAALSTGTRRRHAAHSNYTAYDSALQQPAAALLLSDRSGQGMVQVKPQRDARR